MKKLLFTVITITLLSISQTCLAITMNVVDGNVRDVLATLGTLANRNIITDSSCQGTITVNMHDVDFSKALSIITTNSGLSVSTIDDVIIVTSEEQESKMGQKMSVFKLEYAKAKDTKEVLQNIITNGKISADVISNSLFFRGTPREANHLKEILTHIDKPSKQITLEAKIVSISQEKTSDLGINWAWDRIPQVEQNNGNGEISQTNNDFGGRFKFWKGYSFNFAAKLNALITDGKAKVLARPHIITLPGKEASIFIGDHIPVQTEKHGNNSDYTATEYVDAGIKLRYTPIINSDGSMVTAEVHTEVSTPTLVSDLKNYRITSRQADTNVRMKNGETLIIGGLIGEEETKSVQRIPLLSKLPLLGNLFKNTSKRKTNTEVLMFLTPYITEPGQSPAIVK